MGEEGHGDMGEGGHGREVTWVRGTINPVL